MIGLSLEVQNKLACFLETIILIFLIFRCKQIQICHGEEEKFSKILLKEKMRHKVLHTQRIP